MKYKISAFVISCMVISMALVSIPPYVVQADENDIGDECGCGNGDTTVIFSMDLVDNPEILTDVIAELERENYQIDYENTLLRIVDEDSLIYYYAIPCNRGDDNVYVGMRVFFREIMNIGTVELTSLSDGVLLIIRMDGEEIANAVGNEITGGTLTVTYQGMPIPIGPGTDDWGECVYNCLWEGFVNEPYLLLLCIGSCAAMFIPPFIPGVVACISCVGPTVGACIAYCLITDPPWMRTLENNNAISVPLLDTETGVITYTNYQDLVEGDVVDLDSLSEDWYYQLN